MSAATFSGRIDELQLLSRCLGRASCGQPQVVLIEGAPGVGKSALLEVFEARAAQREKASWVFYVRAPEEGGYAPIAQAAVEATNKLLYDRVGGRRKAIEAARELLPEWMNAIPVWGNLVAAVIATGKAVSRRRGAPEAASTATPDDDGEALLAVAARHTLVLLFDDLHHEADITAVHQIERLLRAAAAGAKLLVVGTYRPAPHGVADPPIHRLIRTLPAGTVQQRQLRELSVAELQRWLQKRFPHVEVPPEFLRWLFEHTGGHPATVEAALAQLIQRSVIRFVDRHWEIGQPPLELNATFAAEPSVDLRGIAPTTVAVLQTASALGSEFDGTTLARVLDRDELWVEDQLALAVHQGLVETIGETSTADGEISTLYRFQSTHLRARLVQELSSQERGRVRQRQDAIAGTV